MSGHAFIGAVIAFHNAVAMTPMRREHARTSCAVLKNGRYLSELNWRSALTKADVTTRGKFLEVAVVSCFYWLLHKLLALHETISCTTSCT